MTSSYNELVKILREVFQLDQADLDFGIYRILNQRSAEITDFLENKLLAQVKQTLSITQGQAAGEAQTELDTLLKTLRDAGVPNPEDMPKVKELRANLAQSGSADALADDVFNHMATFFRRYYKEGDFISQRRYKDDVYAIPYSGEEVKLYWANHDQYYIKTAEYFKNYAFKLGDKTISFELKEAATEQNNNKTQNNQERRFALFTEQPFTASANTLTIHFTYDAHPKTTKQKDLLEQAVTTLRAQLPPAFADLWKTDDKGTTLLEKKLADYTARNTFDYFIHKDLGGFLNRELDFYIKNEILHLDDIDYTRPQAFEKQLRLINAFKETARKLIAFLAQLENFQKKLWLKKKFVVETNYCITLDRVPEQLYPEIAQNDRQIDEWIRLFSIDEIQGDLHHQSFSKPLSVDFLKENPFLVLDTTFFPKSFTRRLLQGKPNFDDQCDGLLINSENFQALNFLEKKYLNAIDFTYIDPPYNTSASEIAYKNGYRESSWITMISNRLQLSKRFLNNSGILTVAIDDTELIPLSLILDEIYLEYERNTIVVNHHPAGAGLEGTNISPTHEYSIFMIPNGKKLLFGPEKEESQSKIGFMRTGTADSNLRIGRPNSFYAVLVNPDDLSIVGIENPPYGSNYPTGPTEEGYIRIYPKSEDGTERVWRRSFESCIYEIESKNIVSSKSFALSLLSDNEGKFKPIYSNWTDTKYNAGIYGSNILNGIIGTSLFSYPKSLFNLVDCINFVTRLKKDKSTILDYFAGSGTTGHAVIHINREDGGKRKYILVEMGTYFDTVTKPRIQKVVYSKDWKDGKPVGRDGISHCFKTLRLESYEDVLNNLVLKKPSVQTDLLPGRFDEEYTLQYWLDVETRDSLLNLNTFKKPYGHTMQVTRNNERTPVEIDLVETFNYLLGLTVDSWLFFDHITVVIGRNRSDQKVLVLWRDCDTVSNEALNTFFRKQSLNPLDYEYDRIYVNGDNTLENIRLDEEHWKVMLIEQEFHRLMFEGTH